MFLSKRRDWICWIKIAKDWFVMSSVLWTRDLVIIMYWLHEWNASDVSRIKKKVFFESYPLSWFELVSGNYIRNKVTIKFNVNAMHLNKKSLITMPENYSASKDSYWFNFSNYWRKKRKKIESFLRCLFFFTII